MNIFYLDESPIQSARWMIDKHVVKMIVESAQLLSTAHRVLDGDMEIVLSPTGRKSKQYVLYDGRDTDFYKATHVNHPSAIWCRSSVENYGWLVDHLYALLAEYSYRYSKKHKTADVAYYLQSPPFKLKKWDFTPPPSAMAQEYIISDDPIVNYRNYYKLAKTRMHSWKLRDPPPWI